MLHLALLKHHQDYDRKTGFSSWGGGVCGNVYQRGMDDTTFVNGVMIHPPFIFDITDTSNQQMRINVQCSDNDLVIEGSGGEKTTFLQFIRLGDT